MAYKLSKIEQETIILFNEAEEIAEIYTFNTALKNRLMKLAKTNERVRERTQKTDFDGSKTFLVPKAFIKVNPPKKLSEETKRKYIGILNRNK